MHEFKLLNELLKSVSGISAALQALTRARLGSVDSLTSINSIATYLDLLKKTRTDDIASGGSLHGLLEAYEQSVVRLLQVNDHIVNRFSGLSNTTTRSAQNDNASVMIIEDGTEVINSKEPDESTYQLLIDERNEQIALVEVNGLQVRDQIKRELLATTVELQPSSARLPNSILLSPISRMFRPYGWSPEPLQDSDVVATEHHSQEILEKYGAVDQKVDDFVDQAEGLDARRAIQLLQKAFRHSKSPASKCKVYLCLAMKYEELGDLLQAVENYTRSMDITEPFAIALYYRGQVYYQLGQLADARCDLIRALEIPKHRGLDTYCHEKAKLLLDKIKQELAQMPDVN